MQSECSSPQGEASRKRPDAKCYHVDDFFVSHSRGQYASIIHVSLQEGAALPWSSDKMSAGASSFGMSGVNAHALFASPKVLAHNASEVDWQRERHWMVPSHHIMLASAQYSRQAGQCRSAPSTLDTIIESQRPIWHLP